MGKIIKRIDSFLGESQTFIQKKILLEALDSITVPYRHLVDVYIPTQLKLKILELGLVEDQFSITRKVNLTEQECITFGRTLSYQWHLTLKGKERGSSRKLLEVPFLNDSGTSIINGLRKVFVLKIKRRNAVFRLREGIKTLTITNLRNKRFVFSIKADGTRSLFSSDEELNLEKISEENSCIPLLRDAKMLTLLGKGEKLEGVNLLEKEKRDFLFSLLEKVDNSVFEEMHPVNKSWISCGGYIKDLIQRAFYNVSPEIKPGLENSDIFDIVFRSLNLKDLALRINQYTHDGSFVQLLDDINQIAEIIHSRKVSLLYKGLLSRSSAIMELRDLNPYMQGRLCPISTSEGQTIGLIKHLALGAKFDKDEEVLVPYYGVSAGQAAKKPEWLYVYDEINTILTDYTSFHSKEVTIKARLNNKIIFTTRDKVKLVMAMPKQTLGLGIALINQNNNSEPDRMMMAGNMIRQSLCLKYPDVPLVRSEINDLLCSWYKSKLSVSGSELFSSRYMVNPEGKGPGILSEIPSYKRSNGNTSIMFKTGEEGSIAPLNSQDGTWSFGKNLRVGYLSWEGLTFEDSLVISESVIRKEMFTSLHIKELKVPIFKIGNSREKITRNVINAFKYDFSKLDESGVITEGSKIYKGDILVSKIKPVKKKQDTPEQRLLLSILGERNFSYRNDFFYLPYDIQSATVIKVDYQRGRMSKKDFLPWIEDQLSKLNQEKEDLIKRLMGRFNLGNYEKESERRRKLPSELKAVIDFFQQKEKALNDSMAHQDSLMIVKIVLLIEKPFEVGDKLTGAHGNKGVVSKIIPDYDMPFDEDGRHPDILISNLSVYGRLNFSQMIESYAGSLHSSCLDWLSKNDHSDEAREKLSKVLNVPLSRLAKANPLEIEKGLRFVDSSFDPLSRGWGRLGKIKDLVGFEEMKVLRCGITGETLANPVHTGILSIYKLCHTVNTKMSARSVGSSSIKHNQPTRGKHSSDVNSLISSGMAQKIGTMEKDSLVSRGLWKLLHEMFSLRSDNIVLRRKVLNGEIFKLEADEIGEWSILESTRSLIYYLKGLMIDMRIDREENMPSRVRFSILKQEDVLKFSKGEINKAETIHYRTRLGIEGGLFCPKIFGSEKDNSCECEKYMGKRYAGITCPNCRVLVTSNRARRNFYGHLNLVLPVVNIKFMNDSVVKAFLPLPSPQLNALAEHKGYLYISEGGIFTFKRLWLQNDQRRLSGGEAIQYLIDKVNPLTVYRKKIMQEMRKSSVSPITLRMRKFLISNNNLSDIIVKYLPILPKHLRPLMFTGTGSYISTDLNNLYLKVSMRNTRLSELLSFQVIPFVIASAYADLQEQVNSLLWIKGTFSSIADNLKGKFGIIRQHILSKRINFSGRSVITINPTIPSGFCGVPRSMLLKIFLPLIQKEMVESLIAESYYEAFTKIKEGFQVGEILDKICKENLILLNRNPTLHSLSIQSFFPFPVEHNAIEVHPLTLKAFGGDIDGDSENVFPALTKASNQELFDKTWEKSTVNPSNYEIPIKPSREIALGLWYLTEGEDETGDFLNLNLNNIEQHFFENKPSSGAYFQGKKTTLGRAYLISIFQRYLGSQFKGDMFDTLSSPWDNNLISKIEKIVLPFKMSSFHLGEFYDILKNIGNRAATLSGYSFKVEELLFKPESVHKMIGKLTSNLLELQDRYQQGFIGHFRDLQSLIINLWDEFEKSLDVIGKEALMNTVHMKIIDSRHRGSFENLRALSLGRGIVSFVDGLWPPVVRSLTEGYNEMDFLLLSKIGKKLMDKALGTAKGGYFNRKLLETLREFKIYKHDCQTKNGIFLDSDQSKDFWGRISVSGEVLTGFYDGLIRSPLTCESPQGVCQRCFGYEPGLFTFPSIGKSIGSLSAYALAEPVTQMMMKTKHLRYLEVSEEEYVPIESDVTGNIELGSYDQLVKTEDNKFRNTGFSPVKVSVKGIFILWLQHGELVSAAPLINKGETIVWKLNKDMFFAPIEGLIRVDEVNKILNLSNSMQSVNLRFTPQSELKVKSGEKVQAGSLLFYNSRAIQEDALKTSFEELSSLFSKRDKTTFDPHYNFYAPHDCTILYLQGKVNIISPQHKFSFLLPEVISHRLIHQSSFKANDLVYIGSKGYHPHHLLEMGETNSAVALYLKEIKNIYLAEKINVLRVHLEILLRELLLSGKDVRGRILSIPYMQSRSIKVAAHSPKFINDPHPEVDVSPLSTIGFEDVVRNLIKIALNGSVDRLNSINGNLLIGCPIPIEDNFNADLSTDN